MRSSTVALVWEIWRKNHRLVWLVLALILLGGLFNAAGGESIRVTPADRERLLVVNSLLACASIFLVFGIFNYTEIQPRKEWTGFPYHLFVLPVPTWRLVALPMATGVAAAEGTYLAWLKLVFTHGELVRPGWFAVLIAGYLVFFQTVLWTLAAFRVMRMVILGLIGTSFFAVAFMPFFAELAPAWWLSEKVLIWTIVAMSLAAYATAWNVVARQRTGGGRRENWLRRLAEVTQDILPRRQSDFASAAEAQFWFEWRRSGLLLPIAVAAILIAVVAPLSWRLRDEPAIVLWILPQTLAMPVVLAWAMGKGLSKPDFWSRNLSLPAFLATQPISTGEMVVAKLKAAALSAFLAWVFVLAFLCLWLALWAKTEPLAMTRIGYWLAYGHSVYPQYVIAALWIIASALLTWRFLVGGLCVGLSGSRKLFLGSAAAYGLVAVSGIIGLVTLLNHDERFRGWIRRDPNTLLSIFEWVIAIAVIVKFWLAAFSWSRISRKRALQYLLLWTVATSLSITLAMLVWAKGTLVLFLLSVLDFLPLDSYRLLHFLILLALLVVPLGRLGLAPSALARNRHGGFPRKEQS